MIKNPFHIYGKIADKTALQKKEEEMYWALVKCCFKQQIQYKWNLLFQIIGDWLRIYIKICIWQALFQAGTKEMADLKALIVYSVTASLIIILTNSHVAGNLSDRVRSGMIAIDLIRPVSLKWYCFFQQIGENLFHFLFEGIFIAVLSWLIWKLPLPEVKTAVPFLLCLVLGVVIMFYIQYTIGLLVFWMKDGTYTRMITDALFVLFSGIEIPLWFYPEWLKKVSQFLPFRFVVFEPVTVWLGQAKDKEIVWILCMQILWLLILSRLERRLWKYIKSTIEIQGG